MVGGGVFSLPHDLAVGANSGSIIVAGVLQRWE